MIRIGFLVLIVGIGIWLGVFVVWWAALIWTVFWAAIMFISFLALFALCNLLSFPQTGVMTSSKYMKKTAQKD